MHFAFNVKNTLRDVDQHTLWFNNVYATRGACGWNEHTSATASESKVESCLVPQWDDETCTYLPAMILALIVFPVPGGPSNSTARGRLLSKRVRVLRAMTSYTS